MPNLSTLLGIYLLNLLHPNTIEKMYGHIPALLPLPFPLPIDHLPINQQDPFAIAGSSHNITGPALTPGTAIANICVQLANGPQLVASSRHNPAALQPPAEVGRAAMEALFAQAALNPAPPPPNHRKRQVGRRGVAAIQAQAVALPLSHIIPAPPILPVDHVPIPAIVPIPIDEDALPLPHIPEPAEPVPLPPGPPGPL
ncbi:hypothetical protein BU17DRAFT_84354 [Hysterangium stoloniferum]|nr:hypothetical protein BU17DRAFT_84354 [Hysterangium stoloniferum]